MHKDNTIKTNITYKEYFDELRKNGLKNSIRDLSQWHMELWFI